jgi:hypothetical protein
MSDSTVPVPVVFAELHSAPPAPASLVAESPAASSGAAHKPCASVLIDDSVTHGKIPDHPTAIRPDTPYLQLPPGAEGLKPIAAPPADVKNVFNRSNNGFILAVRLAYNYHVPLRLRPDHIWITVLNSFGMFIEKNAERFRKSFVAHEGKLDLCVLVPPEWEASDDRIQWNDVIASISSLIESNTVTGVRSAFEAPFTTSDAIAATAARVSLMAALKSYFDYSMITMCGIREVKLEGSEADWILLRERVAGLGKLGDVGALLGPWLSKLDTVLSKLVDTYNGRPDTTWWSHIYNCHVRHGSGGGTYISGWFLDFFLYDSRGNEIHDGSRSPHLREEHLPVGYASVPFHWKLLSGDKREFELLAGMWCATLCPDGSVSPWLQWMACEKVVRHHEDCDTSDGDEGGEL